LKDNIVQVADFDQRDRLVIPREGVESLRTDEWWVAFDLNRDPERGS
jgi:hypothetical protein